MNKIIKLKPESTKIINGTFFIAGLLGENLKNLDNSYVCYENLYYKVLYPEYHVNNYEENTRVCLALSKEAYLLEELQLTKTNKNIDLQGFIYSVHSAMQEKFPDARVSLLSSNNIEIAGKDYKFEIVCANQL